MIVLKPLIKCTFINIKRYLLKNRQEKPSGHIKVHFEVHTCFIETQNCVDHSQFNKQRLDFLIHKNLAVEDLRVKH